MNETMMSVHKIVFVMVGYSLVCDNGHVCTRCDCDWCVMNGRNWYCWHLIIFGPQSLLIGWSRLRMMFFTLKMFSKNMEDEQNQIQIIQSISNDSIRNRNPNNDCNKHVKYHKSVEAQYDMIHLRKVKCSKKSCETNCIDYSPFAATFSPLSQIMDDYSIYIWKKEMIMVMTGIVWSFYGA